MMRRSRIVAGSFNSAIFIGACSNGLDQQLFDSKIKMQIHIIYSPELILSTKTNSFQQFSAPIDFNVQKINQTKYEIGIGSSKFHTSLNMSLQVVPRS